MSVTYEGVDTAVQGAISVRQCSQSLKKAFALKYFGFIETFPSPIFS